MKSLFAGFLALGLALLVPTLPPAPQRPASLRFQEGALQAGLRFQHVSGSAEKPYILESMSGGVAVFDYDGDGWMDIYLVNGNTIGALEAGRRSASNALFHNRGDGTFEDVTARAGVPGGLWDMGAVAGDIDNDGHPDLFVTGFGRNTLYHNRGNGTFEEITHSAGLEDKAWSTGASFADFDGDGLLDLAVIHYVVFDPRRPPPRTPLCRYRGIEVQCGPRGLPGSEDLLYRNLSGLNFQEVSRERGLRTGHRYYGLGCVWSDYDNDGDLDLFVANDSCPNFLFRNEKGYFKEVAMESGCALNEDGNEQAGMGVDLADLDQDGWMDLIQTNFSDDKNTLYLNEKGFFLDSSYPWGLGEISWQYLSWGALFFDADLDGWTDLFISNGHVYPQVDRYQIGTHYRQRDFLFHNRSGKGFEEVGRKAGISEVLNSRGAARADLDNDGRVDVVVNHLDGAPSLYWNRTPVKGHWIGFRLEGRHSNRDAVGARVSVQAGPLRQMAEVRRGSSYLSSNDPRLVFGLGQSRPTSISIRWPDGRVQRLKRWRLDRYNHVVEP